MNIDLANRTTVQAIMCPYCNAINGVDQLASGLRRQPNANLQASHESSRDRSVLSEELVQRLQLLQRMQPAELLMMREMLEHMNGPAVSATNATSATNAGATCGQIDRCTSTWTIDDTSRASLSGGCTICLDDFEVGQGMRTLPCFHSFHAHCIESWLEKKRECPNCNFDIFKATSAANEVSSGGAAAADANGR
jgi:E3 ubiquitin-protein ligase SDIR1